MSKTPPTLRIVFPATSANLGPAFDAAALALRLPMELRARAAQQYSIRASGRDEEICGALDNNLILQTYREEIGGGEIPLALLVSNQIPIGKGCGSSAAARLAGVALAAHFGRQHWSGDEILERAAIREGHPDNAAACWLGGVVITQYRSEEQQSYLVATPLPYKKGWPLLLAVPPEACPTEAARRVLPQQYSREDAVLNVRSAMLLTAGIMSGRAELLRKMGRDRIHEPYRSALCPLLGALAPLAGSAGIDYVALSGAGPSVLMFLDPKVLRTRLQRIVSQRVRDCGLQAELIFTSIEERGAYRHFASPYSSRQKHRAAMGSS